MSEFEINFWSNLLADIFVAILVVLLIARPDEKRKEKQWFKQALSLLKRDITKNLERAELYISELSKPKKKIDIITLSPFQYTRGAWNALKENEFLPKTQNPQLVHDLLQMNEYTTIANNNLRLLRYALVGHSNGNIKLLTKLVIEQSKELLNFLRRVDSALAEMNLPEVGGSTGK